MEFTQSGRLSPSGKKWVVGGVVALVVVVFTIWAVRAGDKVEAPKELPPLVSVAAPGLEEVASKVTVSGTVHARNELPLGVDGEAGRILSVTVDVGDQVKKGQVLARLDTSVLAPQVQRLEATLDQARAEAKLAANNWRRAQGVEAAGALSAADIEQRRSTLDTADAQVKMVAAQLAETRARLDRASVRAPTSGVVLTRSAEVGQIVSPGGEPLFRLAQDGEVELRGQVAEQDLPRLAVGQNVSVTLSGQSQPFAGRVRLLGAIIDTSNRLGEVRVALETNPQIRPGAFARGVVTVADAKLPVVPQTAVLSDAAGTYVFILGPEDKVVRRGVTVTDTTAKGVVVGSGLQGDERIVTTAGAFLREGEVIRIAPTNAG